jgi:hypothetical protein
MPSRPTVDYRCVSPEFGRSAPTQRCSVSTADASLTVSEVVYYLEAILSFFLVKNQRGKKRNPM